MIEVFLLVFGVGCDEKHEVLACDVIVNDACASTFAPAFGWPTQLSETTTTGDHIACIRIKREENLQLQDVGL